MKSKYLILLVVFLSFICISTKCTKEEEEEPNLSVEVSAQFTIEPTNGPVNTTFTFDASDSYIRYLPDGLTNHKCARRWDFDYTGVEDVFWDTEFSYEKVVTHKYYEAKSYTIALQVREYTLVTGEFDNTTKILTVSDDVSAPDPAFSIVPALGNVFTEFTFDASGCTDAETPSEELEVIWDFDNDGGWDVVYSTEKVATHSYNQEGGYEVRLNVRDSDGNVSELIKGLTVENCNQGGEPCEDEPFVTIGNDPDPYETVKIGSQCWIRRNLNIGAYFENVNNQSNQTDNGQIEKYCYENDLSNCEKYGGLYQWDEMMNYTTEEGDQGICPNGWHIPTIAEWNTLVNFLGGPNLANEKLKSCTDDWEYSYTVNSNESGFTALPSGLRTYYSPFDLINKTGPFWSSSSGSNSTVKELLFTNYGSSLSINGGGLPIKTGASVRCLRNQ